MAAASSRGWGPPGSGRIVTVRAPNGVAFPGGVRAEISHLVEGMLREFQERGYRAKQGWCWGYAYRKIRGSSTAWSNHAWGLAIDFNAPDHPLGKRGTGVPSWAPEVAARWGFFWGGNYKGRADEMHYEFLGTPGDAKNYPGSEVQTESTEEDDMFGPDEEAVLRDAYNHATQARDTANRVEGKVDRLLTALDDPGEDLRIEVDKLRQDMRQVGDKLGFKAKS